MKPRAILISAAIIACTVRAEAAVTKPDVFPSSVRAATIVTAQKLVAPREFSAQLDKTKYINPFSPAKQHSAVSAVVKSSRPDSDHEFLMILAAQLNPTGVLMLGDQAFLLFGEKKVKVGETLRITFDKETTEVELVDLSRTSFTVKLNNEQITRSIKPAKTP